MIIKNKKCNKEKKNKKRRIRRKEIDE